MDRPARRPGPPVDAARLQPDNQGDIHRVDEGLVGAWLDDPDLAAELADELEQLERLRRLQADEELVLALQLEQFTGRLWARFSRELTRYGLGVLRAWIRHGTIYVKAKKLTGYGLGRIEGWPDDQTIDDIATDTVVAALNYFRDKVLKTHRWQSSGGASLGTFFIGQCLSPTSTAAHCGPNLNELSRPPRRWTNSPKTSSTSSRASRRPSSPTTPWPKRWPC
ncbi:hypothetical protein [Mycobacteroides abscessus]|uniref:hypothetical protein n=1 Tax=Mycobacteroides abscessus TaxID=36809 RepID=UPI001F1D813E|nr:hypothetical protein [Mycobacteroides abscessus]